MSKEICTLKDIRLKYICSLEILSFVYKHPGSTIHQVAEGLDISYQTAQRYLRELRGRGKLIVRLGEKGNDQRFYPNEAESIKVDEVLLSLERTIESVFERR